MKKLRKGKEKSKKRDLSGTGHLSVNKMFAYQIEKSLKKVLMGDSRKRRWGVDSDSDVTSHESEDQQSLGAAKRMRINREQEEDRDRSFRERMRMNKEFDENILAYKIAKAIDTRKMKKKLNSKRKTKEKILELSSSSDSEIATSPLSSFSSSWNEETETDIEEEEGAENKDHQTKEKDLKLQSLFGKKVMKRS